MDNQLVMKVMEKNRYRFQHIALFPGQPNCQFKCEIKQFECKLSNLSLAICLPKPKTEHESS